MNAEIITVGTEILMGNIVNTNAAFLAGECAALGLSSFFQVTVGDNEQRLLELINRARERSEVLIFSGGLGPTEDDLTKEVVAKACGRKLIEDAESRAWIKKLFADWGKVPTENNWKQALIPEGAQAVHNDNGSAPGIILEDKGNHFILLPGPPGELIPMFRDRIRPYLEKLSGAVLWSAMVKLIGIGESKAEEEIRDLIDAQTNPTIATYAKTGEVNIRITARGKNEKKAKEKAMPVVGELKKRFGSMVYTTKQEVSLESEALRLCKKKGFKLSVAESCTGGLLAGRLTSVPGASKVFAGGVVSYTEKIKKKELGVRGKTLKSHGAVSKACAEEMAQGVRDRFGTEVSVSVTGFAGPDGGTEKDPVGTVYFGICCGKKCVVKKRHFSGNRDRVRDAAVTAALGYLREALL